MPLFEFLLNGLLALSALWFGVACVVSAIRFTFRPLFISALSMFLIGVPYLLAVVTGLWSPIFGTISALGSICAVANLFILPHLKTRGITVRQFLFFLKA
jgi:hypothetical protein